MTSFPFPNIIIAWLADVTIIWTFKIAMAIKDCERILLNLFRWLQFVFVHLSFSYFSAYGYNSVKYYLNLVKVDVEHWNKQCLVFLFSRVEPYLFTVKGSVVYILLNICNKPSSVSGDNSKKWFANYFVNVFYPKFLALYCWWILL
jgi:hypothetical protein